MLDTVKLPDEERVKILASIEHVLTMGHGHVTVNVADHKVVSREELAKEENRGVSK